MPVHVIRIIVDMYIPTLSIASEEHGVDSVTGVSVKAGLWTLDWTVD